MIDKIPLAKPYLDEKEVQAVSEVLRSGKLSLGPKVLEFERSFADFIGTKFAVAVNSGTSGLHLCVKSLGLSPGDEVITTPFSFVASSNPIIFEGGVPVFADIDERTCNIDASGIERAITAKTKAILLVHLFGLPCDMEGIVKISRKKGISIIEDSCEALGATYNHKMLGTFGKSAVFAFYPNKQLTTGEGGMIVTDDQRLASLYRSWRNQGRNDSGEWLNHVAIGYNYRLDEMSCALGVEQLKKADFILKKRKEIAKRYTEVFKDVEGLITPVAESRSQRSWWVYFLRAKDGYDRNKIIDYLNSKGVSSRGYFDPPIHLQPIYRERFGFKKRDFPIAEKVAESGFIIPFFVQISDKEISMVSRTVVEAVRRAKL